MSLCLTLISLSLSLSPSPTLRSPLPPTHFVVLLGEPHHQMALQSSGRTVHFCTCSRCCNHCSSFKKSLLGVLLASKHFLLCLAKRIDYVVKVIVGKACSRIRELRSLHVFHRNQSSLMIRISIQPAVLYRFNSIHSITKAIMFFFHTQFARLLVHIARFSRR